MTDDSGSAGGLGKIALTVIAHWPITDPDTNMDAFNMRKVALDALAAPAEVDARVEALEAALGPWVRVWRVSFAPFDVEGRVSGRADDEGVGPLLPRVWPTIGDLRRLAALHPVQPGDVA